MFNQLKEFFLGIPFFKNKNHFRHLLYVHPLLVVVMFDVKVYCLENNIPFKVTSIIRTPQENRALGATSTTHSDGRAFDLSTIEMIKAGVDEYKISELMQFFNRKYKDYAAISKSNNKRTLVVRHIGTADHLHFQLSPEYNVEAYTKL